jgi:ubiquinone/menaquinone biosynthesis C-methylase UbiE
MVKQTAHADQVRRLFDAKAPTWSAKYTEAGRLAGRLTHLSQAVQSHVPPASRVLDLGCGTGELARAMASIGMPVTACDISPRMLSGAAENDRDSSVDWVQLDPSWRRLPFGASSFDAVVASSVLEYVDDPCAIISECARVIQPGGVVLCTVPNTRHPIRWLERAARTAMLPSFAGAMVSRQSSMSAYITYLRLSRQRRSAAWWCTAGAQAGLYLLPSGISANEHLPLRLLTFKRSAGTEEDQCRR